VIDRGTHARLLQRGGIYARAHAQEQAERHDA
jgi:hypothetical protein